MELFSNGKDTGERFGSPFTSFLAVGINGMICKLEPNNFQCEGAPNSDSSLPFQILTLKFIASSH